MSSVITWLPIEKLKKGKEVWKVKISEFTVNDVPIKLDSAKDVLF